MKKILEMTQKATKKLHPVKSSLYFSDMPWKVTYIYIYYIHTEKYSPKSYVLNFRTQISSSQSEERTMVFTREKMIRPIRIANDVFFTCEKNDTSNQKPHRCVSFAPKFPPFIAACSAASLRGYTHSTRKVLLKEYFSPKK